jgi:hypothetical protein
MLGCLLALCSVRLHARSHARGLKLPGMVLDRPMHCHWRLPRHDPRSPQVYLGLRRLMSFREKRLRLLLTSNPLLVSGWVRHSPQIFTVSTPQTYPGAAHLSLYPLPYLFWNGIHSPSSLLHTTGNPAPLVTVLNSSLHLPTAYHIGVESKPAHPRHVH